MWIDHGCLDLGWRNVWTPLWPRTNCQTCDVKGEKQGLSLLAVVRTQVYTDVYRQRPALTHTCSRTLIIQIPKSGVVFFLYL